MAPVPIEPEVSYAGAAVVGLHVLSVLYFAQRVASSLRRSYVALSPSQDVRLRLDRRRKLVPLFSGLAALALLAAVYSSLAYASLSFEVWADERAIGGSPSHLEHGIATNASAVAHQDRDPKQLILDRIRWLGDTPLYQDAFEIITEKARRFWWAQQVDLSLVSWSVLLAVEGQRRGIPNLMAFLCLAHLVNLSFAQNLFFVALLLTPTPLPEEEDEPPSRLARLRDAAFPPKPRDWCLGPGILLLSVMASYGTIFLLPYATETPSFTRVVSTSRMLTFAPLVLHTIAPTSWGAVHRSQREDSLALIDLFRFMAVMTVILHGAATFTGLRYNVPHAHYHRHSRLLPWDIEERSRWERTTTAVGKLLGATRDHPVVAAVGYDVLISALSVGLWAAVRSLSAGDILASAVPLYLYRKRNNGAADASEHADGDDAASEHAIGTDSQPIPSPRRSTRQRRAKEDENDGQPSTARRRGKPRRARQDPEEEPGDKTYEPTPDERVSAHGDPLPAQEADLEAAGLAWGLMSVGGLGLGSTGVFGGECLAR